MYACFMNGDIVVADTKSNPCTVINEWPCTNINSEYLSASYRHVCEHQQ